MQANGHAKRKRREPLLSVAPMMACTDRHCRYLHRLMSKQVLLYTEMIAAAALAHGPAQRLLGFHPAEHPVAVQIGGAEPSQLRRAASLAAQAGYDEINFNVGCPSPRVGAASFGAVLMTRPRHAENCVAALMEGARRASGDRQMPHRRG